MSQVSFDLDAMIAEANPDPPRAAWTGRAPLHFTVASFSLSDFLEALEEYIAIHGHFNCLAESHMCTRATAAEQLRHPGTQCGY